MYKCETKCNDFFQTKFENLDIVCFLPLCFPEGQTGSHFLLGFTSTKDSAFPFPGLEEKNAQVS